MKNGRTDTIRGFKSKSGKKFDAKPELRELNYKALEMGMNLVAQKAGV